MGELRRLGVYPDEIDFVINTHLHFDHYGGNTVKNADGEIVPAFPNARYIISGVHNNLTETSYFLNLKSRHNL